MVKKMDDRKYLEMGVCPDCRMAITNYFGDRDKPWCKRCDIYFTKMGGWIIRNENAMKQYNELFVEVPDGN